MISLWHATLTSEDLQLFATYAGIMPDVYHVKNYAGIIGPGLLHVSNLYYSCATLGEVSQRLWQNIKI